MTPILGSIRELADLVGKRVTGVRRQLFVDDYNFYDAANRDQESDGPTEFTTDDSRLFFIHGNTEEMAVEVGLGPMPALGPSFVLQDVSSNRFWSSRTGRVITQIDVLQSAFAPSSALTGFGVEFFLHEADSFVIEYRSDEDHLDQVRVTGPYQGLPCRRVLAGGTHRSF